MLSKTIEEILPRERVQASLRHQEPDRIPTALWGGAYGLVDDVYFKLIKILNIAKPVHPFRQGHSISYLDDRVLDKLDTDIRYVWPGASPSSPIISGKDPNIFYDSFGQPWIKAIPYYYADEGILSKTNDIADIEKLVNWPDPDDIKWSKGIHERAKYLREETPYFVTMRMVTSHGVFQTACDLRGMENFMMDMALNPEFAIALIEKITSVIAGLLKSAMIAGGKYFDMIELPGDDYGGNTNLLFSVKMFRTFIKPSVQKLITLIKEYNPEIKVMLHSDGIITPLIEDFIDMGVDVLHPLEPLKGVDIPQIKKQFGDRLSFLGAIDISHALPGSEKDVINEVQTRINQLATNGGYILAPSNHIQADVPPENIITLYQAAKKYGTYPIQQF